uniref:Uncharacterized protein n=1 Tax=Physcomitrium patens TaxID=3218 RepID=A0A7I3ZT25_PHYPA
ARPCKSTQSCTAASERMRRATMRLRIPHSPRERERNLKLPIDCLMGRGMAYPA